MLLVCVQHCAKTMTVKKLSEVLPVSCVGFSWTHNGGNESGALGHTVTARRSSAYENECWHVLNWLGSSGVSRKERWLSRLTGQHAWFALRCVTHPFTPHPLPSLRGPSVATKGRFMAETGQPRLMTQPSSLPSLFHSDRPRCCPDATKLLPAFVLVCHCTFLLTFITLAFEAAYACVNPPARLSGRLLR